MSKNNKDEPDPSSNTPSTSNSEAAKKRNKTLRFEVPPSTINSEESFSSALSIPAADEDVGLVSQKEKDHGHHPSQIKRSRPRSLKMKPCFGPESSLVYEEQEETTSVFTVTSSRQLYEILRNSPTPSIADINLINSTYLRRLDGVKGAIEDGADVNTFRDRQTPLLIATELGDDRLVKYLLSVPGVNPNFQNVFGQTPLIVAVKNNFDVIIRLLLKCKADVNITDTMGRSPLFDALLHQRPSLVSLLFSYGAKNNIEDCFGERPIYTAAVKKPSVECLTLLFRKGASPEYFHVSGMTLLMRTILNWTDFEIIKTLVKYGASVNAKEIYTGKTPLHFAAMVNSLEVAEFLINNGADVDIRTVYGFTPFDEAVLHQSMDVAEFLVHLTTTATRKAYSDFQAFKNALK